MNIQDYLTTYAPSSHAVEKTLNVLMVLAPHPDSVWRVLNTLATFAPNISSVWMFPLAALALAIIHALITRRAGMMVGAALILCFYTVGHVFLPMAEVSTEKQIVLLVALHTWFSCVAAYFFFVCIAASLFGHFAGIGWRFWRSRSANPTFVLANSAFTSVTKKSPAPRTHRATFEAKPKTLNELAAARAAKSKKLVRREPTL